MSPFDPYNDFDELVLLAEQDPEQFEAHRNALIANEIENSPTEYHQKLRQLQWKIDGIKHRAKDEMHTLLELHKIMQELLQEQQSLFQQVADLCNGRTASENISATPKSIPDNVVSLNRSDTNKSS